MLRTYDRFASPPECAATSNAGCGGGGGVIGAKDRPGNLTGASDPEVVAWAKQGHEAAFRELVRRYERPIFSLLYRMVRDRALAEDLAQETFIKVLNAIGTYNPQFKFSSWIFKIANNAAIDHLRRRELETLSLDGSPHATTPDEMSATAPQLGDRGETPLQELEARELGGAIEHAIARLRPEYRTCILLRHVEGHSYEEIARILDLPLGTVKTYIHRARNELRGHLEDRREGNPGARGAVGAHNDRIPAAPDRGRDRAVGRGPARRQPRDPPRAVRRLLRRGRAGAQVLPGPGTARAARAGGRFRRQGDGAGPDSRAVGGI